MKLLIVQQELGRYSEVFLYRMLNGFTKINIELLTGEHTNKLDFPFNHIKFWNSSANFFVRLSFFLRYRLLGYQGTKTARLRNIIHEINTNDANMVCFQFGFIPERLGKDITKINKPFCIIHHGTDINQAVEDKTYHQRLKLVWEQADKIIFVSYFLMDVAIKLGCPKHKACINYLGVPDFEQRKHRPSNDNEGPFKFIMVARMVPVKNHINIIRAFACAIEESNISIQLTLIGYGELEDTIEVQISELGIKQDICLLGKLCNEEVIKEFAKADCTILVSKIHSIKGITNQQEGLPISLLEGARLGLPAIGSYTGGIPEIIVDDYNGYLVDPLDIGSIKNAMLKMIQNPEKTKSMGKNAKDIVQKKFNFNVQMQRFENIFLEILE